MEGKGKIKSEEQKRINRDQLLTVGDLEIFRTELIQEIGDLLKNAVGSPAKKWLKSTEVKKLLAISTGTLQTLRMNGTLSHSKMGGTIYYNQEEILKLLKDNEQR
ncbi:MAG TPA: helix-turn-helix domain-containing protein [Ohtaekwangia sp.]